MRAKLPLWGLSLLLGMSPMVARADDWPQWLGPHRDAIYRETGTLKKFKESGAVVRWRTPIAGGYAGPAVADGRVFVTDYLTQGDTKPSPEKRNELEGTEGIHCLDAKTGKEIWKHTYPCNYKISYPAGPRATPTVDGDLVYCLGAEGNLFVLEAATGKVVWSKEFKKEFKIEAPLWGFCSHPLIVGDTLYLVAGGEGSVAVAYDKRTGKELWRALSAKGPGYGTPAILDVGASKQLIVWHAEAINSLDPTTGKVLWTYPLEPSYGMSIMAPQKSGDFLFAGGIGNKAALLELDTTKPAAKERWQAKGKMALFPVCSPPFIDEGVIYGADQPGQFRAVELATGKRLWETGAPTTGGRPASSAASFIVKNGKQFFLFSETGHLITAELSPAEYKELSRAKILEPTGDAFGRLVVWSHPAFAQHTCFARNDKEIVAVSLAAEDGTE